MNLTKPNIGEAFAGLFDLDHLPADSRGQIRALAAQAVERLIDLIDHLDGDPDLEDGHDLEQVSEDEGAQCDDEGIDSDSEPDDHFDPMWHVVALAVDQTGTKWATG